MRYLRCATVAWLVAWACAITPAASATDATDALWRDAPLPEPYVALGAAAQTGTVKVPDGELYYEMRGSGPTVVLLHGGLLDGRMWDEQFGVLAGRYRVLRYDARGHGRSSRIAGDYCNHRDLHALLTALGIRKAADANDLDGIVEWFQRSWTDGPQGTLSR